MSSTTQALFKESPQQGGDIMGQMGKETDFGSSIASPTSVDTRELERIFLVQKQDFERETYPEYHTSGDNLNLIRSEYLATSLTVYQGVVNAFAIGFGQGQQFVIGGEFAGIIGKF